MNRGRHKEEKRVLAIDPSTRGFGYAVLEGPSRLVDWGGKAIRKEKHRRSLDKIKGLIDHYRPDCLVLEDYGGKGSRRSVRVQALIRAVMIVGLRRELLVRRFSRSDIRAVFEKSGAKTKDDIAAVVAGIFPELELILPPRRRPWTPERESMNIFDAVALALTFYHRAAKRRGGINRSGLTRAWRSDSGGRR